jgi:hypothetical protein
MYYAILVVLANITPWENTMRPQPTCYDQDGGAEAWFNRPIEGQPKGAKEGSLVGSFRGPLDGDSDGILEGITVGSLDGSLDGSLYGSFEGSLDGVSDGILEGSLAGLYWMDHWKAPRRDRCSFSLEGSLGGSLQLWL